MGRQCLLCFVNDVVNIQNLSNSKIFTLSLHYSKSSGESFELCDKGLLGNFLKDIQQRSRMKFRGCGKILFLTEIVVS